jgi:hypothetical protein
MSSQHFPQEFQCCLLVPRLRDEAFKHFTFVMDGPPLLVSFAVGPQESFVKVPQPVARAHLRKPALSDFRLENGPNLRQQNHTVSWQISMLRSCSRSFMFLNDGGNRTYIIATRPMPSGEVLKYLNEVRWVISMS